MKSPFPILNKLFICLEFSVSVIMLLAIGCSRDAGYTPVDPDELIF
ncbi:MAG: hypothetical protein R6W88_09405 [Desulfobacterales bacterium]